MNNIVIQNTGKIELDSTSTHHVYLYNPATTTTSTTSVEHTALNFGSLHNYQSESCVDSSVSNTVYVSTADLASSGGNLTAGMNIYWDTSLTLPWEVGPPNPGSYVSFTYQYNTIHYATVSISHNEDGSTTGIIYSVENCCGGGGISCIYATSKSNYCSNITENRLVYTDTGSLNTATSIFMICSSNPSERILAENGVYAYYDVVYWDGLTVETYNCPTTTTTTTAATTTTTTAATTTTTTTVAQTTTTTTCCSNCQNITLWSGYNCSGDFTNITSEATAKYVIDLYRSGSCVGGGSGLSGFQVICNDSLPVIDSRLYYYNDTCSHYISIWAIRDISFGLGESVIIHSDNKGIIDILINY